MDKMQRNLSRSPWEAVEVKYSARVTSGSDGSPAFGSVEASSQENQEDRSRSTLSNISKITIQSNNNAKITRGQRSGNDDNDDDDQGSSSLGVSNRSLPSSLAIDSTRSESGGNRSPLDKTPDSPRTHGRLPRAVARNLPSSRHDSTKYFVKPREMSTPKRYRKSRIPLPVTKKIKPPLSTDRDNPGITKRKSRIPVLVAKKHKPPLSTDKNKPERSKRKSRIPVPATKKTKLSLSLTGKKNEAEISEGTSSHSSTPAKDKKSVSFYIPMQGMKRQRKSPALVPKTNEIRNERRETPEMRLPRLPSRTGEESNEKRTNRKEKKMKEVASTKADIASPVTAKSNTSNAETKGKLDNENSSNVELNERKSVKVSRSGHSTGSGSRLQKIRIQDAKAERLPSSAAKPQSIGAETRKSAQTVTPKRTTNKATSSDNISVSTPTVNINKTQPGKRHCNKVKVKQRELPKKTNPGRRPYISEIDAYCALQAEVNEDNKKIVENKKIINAQEKEMDKEYEDVRQVTDKILEATHEVVDARKIHANFKDEATRIRVHHKTNLVTADIYETETIFIQEHITEMQQEITELKAMNRVTPEELKGKIKKIQAYDEEQKQRNSELEEHIETLTNILNDIRCGGDYKRTELKTPDDDLESEMEAQQHDEIQYETVPSVDHMNQVVETSHSSNIRVGYSKSADVVSERQNGVTNGLRETKSDHTYENKYQSVVSSAKGLLKNRRQNNLKHKQNEEIPFLTKPLLHKRQPEIELQRSINNLMITCSKYDPNNIDQHRPAPYLSVQTDPRLDEKMPPISTTKRPAYTLAPAPKTSVLSGHIPRPPTTKGSQNRRHLQFPPACPWPDGMGSFPSARHKPHPPTEDYVPHPRTCPRPDIQENPTSTSPCPDEINAHIPGSDGGSSRSLDSECTSESGSDTPDSAATRESASPHPDADENNTSEGLSPDRTNDKDDPIPDSSRSSTKRPADNDDNTVSEKATSDDKDNDIPDGHKPTLPSDTNPDEKDGSVTARHDPRPPTSSRQDNKKRRIPPVSQKPAPVIRPRPAGKTNSVTTDHAPRPPACPRPDNKTPRVKTNQTANKPSNQSTENRNKPGQRRNERHFSPEVPRLPPCNETVTVNGMTLRYI